MKIRDFSVEIVIGVASALLSLLGFFDNPSTVIILLALGFCVDIILVTIKYNMYVAFKPFQDEVYSDKAQIDPYWKQEADEEEKKFRNIIKKMKEGQREIDEKNAFEYQRKVILNAKKSIDAIHIGLDENSLKKWLPDEGDKIENDFSNVLISANHAIKDKNITRRRIFIIHKSFRKNNRNIIKKIEKYQKENLNFEVIFITIEELNSINRSIPDDILIIDNKETVIVRKSNDNLIVNTRIDKEFVQSKIREFNLLWSSKDTNNG